MTRRLLLGVAATAMVASLLSACRARETVTSIPVGSSTATIEMGALTRTYHLYRPATLANPAPLVVFLHGGFGTGGQAEKSYHWDAEADTGHFLVAYPDGVMRAWNTGGGCCGIPERTGVDDVGFITAMVAAIESETPINTSRVYATGISNGGIMAYALACRTTIVAAIGPDSATQLGDCSDPAPTSVIHIHGTADNRIPYGGGSGSGFAHIDGPAVPALNAAWRAIDRCRAPAVTVAGVVTTSVARCPAGRTVELISIAGAGHQWPGGVPNTPVERLLQLDPPSTAIDATAVMWAFFRSHPKVS